MIGTSVMKDLIINHSDVYHENQSVWRYPFTFSTLLRKLLQPNQPLMKILNINVYGILPMWFCFLYEPNSCLYLILCTLNKCDSAYSYYGRQEYHSHKEQFLMTMWLWENQKATDLGVSARLQWKFPSKVHF